MLKISVFLIISGLLMKSAAEINTVKSADSALAVLNSDSIKTLDADTTLMKSTLVISTEPSDATVLIDDSLRGLSPLTVSDIDTGLHLIVLKKKGFYLKKAEVRIDSIQKKELHFLLQQPSTLYIATEPSGATLTVNQKMVGKSPYINKQTKPGEYVISAEMENYQKIEQTFFVQSNISDTLILKLKHTAAYLDSIKTSEMQSNKRQRLLKGSIVGAAFALFGLVLLFIEARE